MSYTFRIHKGTDAQEDGWQRSEELVKRADANSGIESIEDRLENGNGGKIGTSIPTPFARIYLFETAFSYAVTKKSGVADSFYDYLVTQALDLLQLIFEKGVDPLLKLYEWDGQAEVRKLNDNYNIAGHATLANALNMSINSNPSLRRIILVEYDGVLLGGTSPFTVTYTSPNAIRLLLEKKVDLLANDKSPLFRERSVKHLKDRSPEFKKFVKWLVFHQNAMEFQQDGSSLATFYSYVRSQLSTPSQQEYNDLAVIPDSYYCIIRRRHQNGDLALNVCGNVFLRYNNEPIDMQNSDFYMRPSIRCFRGPVPVVLPTDGSAAYDGWNYTRNERWQSLTTFDHYLLIDTPVEERYLPTNGAQSKLTTNRYPWLTTGDFFEDSLLDLGFNLNSERFYFPQLSQDKGYRFLLPIKKEYFNYFTADDLLRHLKCQVNMDSSNRVQSVDFDLSIPLQNKEEIVLHRTYTAARSNERVLYRIVDYESGFSFGVFPFYRCPKNEDVKNEYSVYLYSSSYEENFVRLNFYQQSVDTNSLIRIVDSDTEGQGEGLIRTKTTTTGISRVYNLRNETTNSFDLIEVKLTDGKTVCNALAIPMWFRLPPVNESLKSFISIDFGTTNTYVSYLENGLSKPLTITEEDQQMVLLNSSSQKAGTKKRRFRYSEDFGDATYMSQYLREFVPSRIGASSDVVEEEAVEYPIKTATIEKLNFASNQKLFSSISIGFNIDNERSAVDSTLFKYVTNLKWNAEEHKSHQSEGENLTEFEKDRTRIKAFCEQTLWMIKNKLVLKGYSNRAQLMYFYPDSMSTTGREIFESCWEEAVDSVLTRRGFVVDVKAELEAISPFYSLQVLHADRIGRKSTANIDIGGGTTDYFILDQYKIDVDGAGAESGHAYEASVFFAGNDLWGAAYPQSMGFGRYQENGFVRYMQKMVKHCSQEANALYNAFDQDKGMADFSGFFFKNDNLFKFSDKVASNEKFRFVVFLHYAAIIYHFTDMIKLIRKKDPEFRYPEILTFTGKGSEYVKMLSKQMGELSEVTTQLIKAFGVKDFNGLDILAVQNPKALTADGGIYEMMSHSSLKINLFDMEAFGARRSKSSVLINTPYERIGKKCIGLGVDKVTEYKISEVQNLKPIAMEYVKSFADVVYKSPDLNSTRKFLRFNFNEQEYEEFMKYASQSYDVHASRFLTNNVTVASLPLEESVFFFAMKNTLISLSNYYYNQIKDQ